ncbi:hypothetical protein [Streptomyces alboflavus]|uniref:hypothetical protein n=1 Tax=Streptomyces alboflavus TaxID=67267 RepID=UPI00193B36A7|nr:hypothetical protein [Streptomyces alboflavus]
MPTRQADFGPRPHLLPLYDVLLLNAREARHLLCRAGTPASRPRGCVIWAPAWSWSRRARTGPPCLGGARRGPVPAREPGACADDTGAGDALAAAFVLGLSTGASPGPPSPRGAGGPGDHRVPAEHLPCRVGGRGSQGAMNAWWSPPGGRAS